MAGRQVVVLDRDQTTAFYGDRPTTDPDGLVREFAQLVEDAIARGYTGLAVSVDATGVVTSPADRAAFARVEHLADRMIRSSGTITGMCLYDAEELSSDALDQLGSLHQSRWPFDTAFHLCASGDHRLRLDGELDHASLEALDLSWTAIDPFVEGDAVVDASKLDFVDQRSLRVLDAHAAAAGHRIILCDAKPIVERLVELVDARHLVVLNGS